MTEQIKAALRGDPDAAAECTAAGVAIPCGHCGGKPEREWYGVRKGYEATVYCGCLAAVHTITYDSEDKAMFEALATWNRRVRMED